MRIIVHPYLPPDEWRIGLAWSREGGYQARVCAGTLSEAEELGRQMKVALEPAIIQCEELAQKSFRRRIIFDD